LHVSELKIIGTKSQEENVCMGSDIKNQEALRNLTLKQKMDANCMCKNQCFPKLSHSWKTE
jgi:hypothetical protein